MNLCLDILVFEDESMKPSEKSYFGFVPTRVE